MRQVNNRHDRIDTLPKSLLYDGSDSWKAFQQKFMRFAEVKNWRPQESKDYLGWCLEGRASEYFATVVTQNADIGFLQLMQKLEKRFGYKEIPETAQLKMNSLMQANGESIEDWADRVFQLALRAYEGLPEEHMLKQAIKSICHGCMDKEAGQYAVNQHPDTIEETIEYLKSFQYNHKAIFGRSRREVREILCDDNSEKLQVNAVNKEGVRERMSRLESHIGSLKSDMKTIMKQMEALVKLKSESPQRSLSRSPIRSLSPGLKCYHCGETGHFKADCPSLNAKNRMTTNVSFTSPKEEGIEKGAGQKAML